MSHETRVFAGFGGAAGETLRAALRRSLPATADWRTVPHARFSVRAEDVVVTCYESGKVVVQGDALDSFLGRHLPSLATSAQSPGAGVLAMTGVTLGSDEAGKGDYFGPLVVVAACVRPEQEERLRAAGVTDSKRLSDERAHLIAGLLEREVPFEVSQLMPEQYNQAYALARNVNVLLADMHARALARLHAKCPEAELVLVDQFAAGPVLARALARELPDHPPLQQITQGERHVAVAAASILARARFLDGLRQCDEMSGTDLHKGAGSPVDAAARRVVAIGGHALLGKVAKLHFKNTERAAPRRSDP
ncbi:MAG: ribonuclease HIII [Planctomycetota bacterium]